MKFIYVLEDDERTQKDLFDNLKNIDPNLCIRFFQSLDQFNEWLRLAIQTGPRSLAVGGQPFKDDKSEPLAPSSTHELRLIIAKDEFFGTKHMNLIKRAQEFFLRKNICSAQDPTALILTAFDTPEFDIKLAEERIINNVIFKPFDKLILRQHLEYALTGHQPISSDTISPIKISSTIEMLKTISIQSISEIGFTTLNNHEIAIGAISKYYGDLFLSGDKKSALAYCKSCKEMAPKEYLCEFHFFGLDNEQISQIRRHILQNKKHQKIELKNSSFATTRVLLLEENENNTQELKRFLQEKISNIEFFCYTHLSQLLADLGDKDTIRRQNLPTQFDIFFANIETFSPDPRKNWEALARELQSRMTRAGKTDGELPKLYMTSQKRMAVEQLKELTEWCQEVFFTFFDKTYIYKKILAQNSSISNKAPLEVSVLNEQDTLKVANPVEITEISEAGLVLKYYRAISIGSFREFILWRPSETDNPEIIGTVNFTDKDQNNGEFFYNHFVFFGMKDFYLKHIRLWLREAYIRSKEKS